MGSLPMLPPSCSLDGPGLSRQAERYRVAGRAARVIERTPRQLVVGVGDEVPDEIVAQLVDVERSCCPFFDLGWEPAVRRLAVSVSDEAHEPALEAVVFALGLASPASVTDA